MTGKVISIAVLQGHLVALCDDGTIWMRVPVFEPLSRSQRVGLWMHPQSYGPLRVQTGWHWVAVPASGEPAEQTWIQVANEAPRLERPEDVKPMQPTTDEYEPGGAGEHR